MYGQRKLWKYLSFNHFSYFANLTLLTPIHMKFLALTREMYIGEFVFIKELGTHMSVACISLFIGTYTAGGKYVIGLHSFELAL